jgi:hypothetical protein
MGIAAKIGKLKAAIDRGDWLAVARIALELEAFRQGK